MSAPFFSVVTPSFNQGAYLRRCLASVVAQGAGNFEHLVYDNLSTDGSDAVAAEFPHVRFVQESDHGQSHAVNKGFAAASGEVICWLNSDDAYPEGVFATVREAFEDSSTDAVFGDVEQVAFDGTSPRRVEARFEDRLDLVRWWSGRARLHQPAIFFRRRAREVAGWLREDLHYAMDYEYWWRMSERFSFRRIEQVLATQYRQPDSKTVRSWESVLAERERIFAPYYGLVDGGDRAGLLREKRAAVAGRHLSAAYGAQSSREALRFLRLAFHESPRFVLHPRSLGLWRVLIRRRS